MAVTVVSYQNCKKHVVSILQASQTAYGSGATGDAPDGSVLQFASATEINDTILEKDGEICTLICNTPGHPYQPQFEVTSSALTMTPNGLPLPITNGMVTRIQCSNGGLDKTFTSGDVNTTSDTVAITNHGFATGQRVQFSNSGGALPTGLSASTDYYIIRLTSGVFRIAATYADATATTAVYVDLTGAGSGTQTVLTQYSAGLEARSRDEITEVLNNLSTYGRLPFYTAGYWKQDGDSVYSTSAYIKVTQTNYVMTSTTQAPEPYLWAIVAGTVAALSKDGFDASLTQYYTQMYANYLQQIAQMARMISPLSAYQTV